MRYLLDTNIVIASLKGHPEVRGRLDGTPLASLLLSCVVLGELAFGAEKSAHSERNRARLADLAARMPMAVVDAKVSLCYARVCAALERQGTPIGANDTWIAAQAVAHGAVLVTDNVREFSRVPGLVVENWLVPNVADRQ
ncbi:MAG: PIN domain-containing protein [Betaproteobacteria bacterium]|nr:PIN domain-containing protein [Betaproteobacteria bacterium]